MEFLHYRRDWEAAHFEWDLDRGFALEVLEADVFALQVPFEERVQTFLIRLVRHWEGDWPLAPGEEFEPRALQVVLSETGRAARIPKDWPLPVIWVRQWMPGGTDWSGKDFFTPEQTLYQWGRVGRRVRRTCRWRSWLPW